VPRATRSRCSAAAVFLKGFGIPESDPQVVCSGDSKGNVPDGQTVMENCLTKDPGINVVYTINEPAAAGAYTALKNRGKDKDVLVVSVDGGCEGVRNVKAGVIGATAQQYPLKMAVMGVDAGVDYATNGKKGVRLHRHRRHAHHRQTRAGR